MSFLGGSLRPGAAWSSGAYTYDGAGNITRIGTSGAGEVQGKSYTTLVIQGLRYSGAKPGQTRINKASEVRCIVPFDFDECLDRGRQLQAQGVSDDDLLQFFRQEGVSMFESVRLIRQLKAISLREAQDLVHFSATWADHKESHEHLQEVFTEALQQLSREGQNESS